MFDVADDNDEKVVSAGLIHESDDEEEDQDDAIGEGSDDEVTPTSSGEEIEAEALIDDNSGAPDEEA